MVIASPSVENIILSFLLFLLNCVQGSLEKHTHLSHGHVPHASRLTKYFFLFVTNAEGVNTVCNRFGISGQ